MQEDKGGWGHPWNPPRLSKAGWPHLIQALSKLGGEPWEPRVHEILRNSLVLRLSGPANLGVLPSQVPRVLDFGLHCRQIVAGRACRKALPTFSCRSPSTGSSSAPCA